VIADTFSCLSRKDDAPGLVGNEVTVSDLAYYSLFDDQANFDCLLNLPCLSSFIFFYYYFFFFIEFQTLLENCHIKDVCTSTKYPQSNAVCERMHQTVGNVLRTLLHGRPPQNITSAKEFVDEALSIASHAMRAGVHATLGSSPGSLVFNRDMFLKIPLITDWHAITQRREHLIHENILHESQKRRRHDYAPQQCILKKCWKPHKLDKKLVVHTGYSKHMLTAQ